MTYLWSEMSDFYFDNLLKIPEGVTVIWTDDGTGFVVDGNLVCIPFGHFLFVLIITLLCLGNPWCRTLLPRNDVRWCCQSIGMPKTNIYVFNIVFNR